MMAFACRHEFNGTLDINSWAVTTFGHSIILRAHFTYVKIVNKQCTVQATSIWHQYQILRGCNVGATAATGCTLAGRPIIGDLEPSNIIYASIAHIKDASPSCSTSAVPTTLVHTYRTPISVCNAQVHILAKRRRGSARYVQLIDRARGHQFPQVEGTGEAETIRSQSLANCTNSSFCPPPFGSSRGHRDGPKRAAAIPSPPFPGPHSAPWIHPRHTLPRGPHPGR
jgi:hypothetical protein